MPWKMSFFHTAEEKSIKLIQQYIKWEWETSIRQKTKVFLWKAVVYLVFTVTYPALLHIIYGNFDKITSGLLKSIQNYAYCTQEPNVFWALLNITNVVFY